MSSRTRQFTYSALMCALTIVSSLWLKFPIPGTDVLFTTQILIVLLCGQLLLPRYCLYTMTTYLLLGIVGIPVFSAVQGIGVMATPSFGYLLAFPFSAASVSLTRILLGHRNYARIIASGVGILTLYTIALIYIALLNQLYFSTPISLKTLMMTYCLAFLPFDILKGILAAYFSRKLEKPLSLHHL